ncbi:putative Zn-dependent protease-like protein [Halobacteroides halobius DSM 5150]|uniref:Putative Zn-dependent protease-like protein n=1 Tax=Halobacteroides halobius (strain ATCC 35273 / DSM 5150 / MD-1) TaxID=748449 RepID=L0K583_HALHC|nr:TldD/PmbA family protein [Halobacteroides halobius]AGB40422.1 putative Zn-dependent protease-like protein [Halobacteroides halobius DSM 5150]
MEDINLTSLLAQAKDKGADEVELYYQRSKNNDLEIYQGEVDSLESANAKGLGVRTFVGDKMGFAYTANFTADALEETITEAIANAKLATADQYRKLPEGSFDYPELNIYNVKLEESSIEDKIDLALQMEEAALEYDDRIKTVMSVNYGDYNSEVRIVNSKGLDESYRSNGCYAYLYVLAKEGARQQTGRALSYGKSLDELKPIKKAKQAVENAIKLLGGQPVKSQEAPVVFTPQVGSMFMYVLAQALTAEAVQKGRSLFAGRLEESVAAKRVNIIDDGTLEEGLATAPFDDEGVPCSATELIKDGVLTNYLYDTYTANKDKVNSTGNGTRGGYRGVPGVAASNFYLAPGNKKPEEIISNVDNGFYVHKVSGLVTGGANPISGEFSVGATGQWIKDGEIEKAVSEITIAGNLIGFLEDIEELGTDLTFNPMIGSFASPTFKVKKLAISGN